MTGREGRGEGAEEETYSSLLLSVNQRYSYPHRMLVWGLREEMMEFYLFLTASQGKLK